MKHFNVKLLRRKEHNSKIFHFVFKPIVLQVFFEKLEGLHTHTHEKSLSNSMGNKKIFYGLQLKLITDRNRKERWDKERE